MGVTFYRKYRDIVADLAYAISTIENSYETFGMTADDWQTLNADERAQYLLTLADDLFYGLGSSPRLGVGSGKIEHDAKRRMLKVYTPGNVVYLIPLI